MGFDYELLLHENPELENVQGRAQPLDARRQTFRPFDFFDMSRFTPGAVQLVRLTKPGRLDIATEHLLPTLAPLPFGARTVEGFLDLSDSVKKGFGALQPVVFAEGVYRGTPLLARPSYGSGSFTLTELGAQGSTLSQGLISPESIFPIGRIRGSPGPDTQAFALSFYNTLTEHLARTSSLAHLRLSSPTQFNAVMHASEYIGTNGNYEALFVITGHFNK